MSQIRILPVTYKGSRVPFQMYTRLLWCKSQIFQSRGEQVSLANYSAAFRAYRGGTRLECSHFVLCLTHARDVDQHSHTATMNLQPADASFCIPASAPFAIEIENRY